MKTIKHLSLGLVSAGCMFLATTTASLAVSLKFDSQIGKPGLGGSGELLTPQGISVQDSTGNIFVANGRAANPDGSLNTNVGSRVEVFDPQGNYLRSITRPRTGKGEGLDGTADLKFDPKTGLMHIGDVFNSEIDVYNPDTGEYVRSYGSFTGRVGDRPFFGPGGMSFDNQNRLWVTDFSGDVIKIYDANNGELLRSFGSSGTGSGQYQGPAGLSVSPNTGRVYVSDQFNNRIKVLDQEGNNLFSFGTPGNGPGQFGEPIGVELDEFDNIYIADSRNSRVQVFDKEGNFLTSFGQPARNAEGQVVPPPTPGGPSGPYGNPLDLSSGVFNWTGGAHYNDGKLLVGDFFQGRVQVLDVDNGSSKKVPEPSLLLSLAFLGAGATVTKLRQNQKLVKG